jgi:intein/homing endonuclease
MIHMADNTLRKISEVMVGDSVMTFDFGSSKLIPQNVVTLMVPRDNIELWNLELSNGKILEVTGGHPIHTSEGWKYINESDYQQELVDGVVPKDLDVVGQIEEGDEVFGIFEQVVVKSISKKEGTHTVYHLSDVEHTHNFFAEGILVHNMGMKF